MFPFEDQSTLLCHTWNQNISMLSNFRVKPSPDFGILSYINNNIKGNVCKNERGYRHSAKNNHFWLLLILLLSVASLRRKWLKTTHTEERSIPYKFRKLQHSTQIIKKINLFPKNIQILQQIIIKKFSMQLYIVDIS